MTHTIHFRDNIFSLSEDHDFPCIPRIGEYVYLRNFSGRVINVVYDAGFARAPMKITVVLE